MDLGLAGKIALVSGGSRGIGMAIADRLAAEGCDLMLAARDPARLAETAAAIRRARGRRVETVAADLSTLAGCEAAVAAQARAYGRLDILVNNAGVGRMGEFLSLSEDAWAEGFDLKLFAQVRLSRLAWPMLKAARGAVVNIAGTRGLSPGHLIMISSAANAAAINFAKALAGQGLIDDVNVNVVAPGVVATELHERYVADQARVQGISVAEAKARKLAQDGLRRFASPEDVAAAVAFLASPAARHVTGTVTVVDGGGHKGI